jgi:acetylornithine/succinyldiaminopimelate/putrescine aminotransferase
VQTGLGRTGAWFAHQHVGIVPDIVTIAKALGNGMPIGACWARREIAASFVPGDHGSTFGGQPLAASAALATLRIMEREDLPARAAKVGEHLQRELADLPGVSEVRGMGLLLAIELEPGIDAKAVQATALDNGLVTNAVTPTAVRFAPPLTVAGTEVDEALAILRAALDAHRPVGEQ